MSNIVPPLHDCQVDFQKGWGNFTTGFQHLLGSGSQGGNDFHFTTNPGTANHHSHP